MFSQSKPRTLVKLREALAPHEPSEYVKAAKKPEHADEHTFYVTGALASQLLGDHPERILPWSVMGWSKAARSALWKGLMDGDGSQPERQYAHAFWSQSQERRDVFLALSLSLGYRAYEDVDNGCINVNLKTCTTELQGKHRKAAPPVPYDGTVWCVKVPKTAFVVRRNGRPFITGNTGFPKGINVGKAIDKAAGAKREKVTPATSEAEKWDGWNTSLKPGHESWVLIRKPLTGTVVANVLEHGVGALNIDATRVATGSKDLEDMSNRSGLSTESNVYGDGAGGSIGEVWKPKAKGRWPANLVFSHSPECALKGTKRVKGITGGKNPVRRSGVHQDAGGHQAVGRKQTYLDHADPDGKETVEDWDCVEDCAVRILGEQSGTLKSGKLDPHHKRTVPRLGKGGVYGNDAGYETITRSSFGGDTGTAARFFYTAKAPAKEKYAVMECACLRDKKIKDIVVMQVKEAKKMVGNTCSECDTKLKMHGHPTVKSIDLMTWLVRLITPPGGLVFDPFTGSGSTGVAALKEDFRFLGFERDKVYVAISRKRLHDAR